MGKSAELSTLSWLDTRIKLKNYQQSLISLEKHILWAVSQNSDYGGAQWMAEVVEIGARRILWLLWIQERHVCFCFSCGYRPNCDNTREECPPQTIKKTSHSTLPPTLGWSITMFRIALYFRLYRGTCPFILNALETLNQRGPNKI